MNDSFRPRLRSDIALRKVDEDFVAYDPVKDRVVLLNLTAAVALELCDGERSCEEIAEQVRARFQGAGEEALDEVRAILLQFSANGLVESEPSK